MSLSIAVIGVSLPAVNVENAAATAFPFASLHLAGEASLIEIIQLMAIVLDAIAERVFASIRRAAEQPTRSIRKEESLRIQSGPLFLVMLEIGCSATSATVSCAKSA